MDAVSSRLNPQSPSTEAPLPPPKFDLPPSAGALLPQQLPHPGTLLVRSAHNPEPKPDEVMTEAEEEKDKKKEELSPKKVND
jgi:hypothetical protein